MCKFFFSVTISYNNALVGDVDDKTGTGFKQMFIQLKIEIRINELMFCSECYIFSLISLRRYINEKHNLFRIMDTS